MDVPDDSVITCIDVPPELVVPEAAKRYFTQFGCVKKIFLKRNSGKIMVQYESPEMAFRAFKQGGVYYAHNFKIYLGRLPQYSKYSQSDEVKAELNAHKEVFGIDLDPTPSLLREKPEIKSPKIKKPVKPVKLMLRSNLKTPKKQDIQTAKSRLKNVIMKVQEEQMESLKMWTSEQLELLKVLKQPADSYEEKFTILDARDKLIRMQTKRSTDISKATKTIGTCPDMCPEKERMLRAFKHQVPQYEQDSRTKLLVPSLAVKEYSRSSADQESPLPHELRPVSVLQMTMSYLMHEIMNDCENDDVNLGDWYHYMWDRTRAIRKDITQQELCCKGSVILVEQCARFHIHCSARLAGEDPSVFDQKINTENLTKCLQTLKYMYNDLHLKGEKCPNEPEFRGYIILLNLNDGNFMWEVQQLDPEIQKSPQVRFALDVYSALDKNNYVKFFKLVHKTSYLNACILLRYFIQVRFRALETIVKCFSSRLSYNQYPLDELQSLLAFEDMISTVDFLEAFNLYLNAERTHVVLDRKAFSSPELPISQERAVNVIEAKRQTSIGEVVCGTQMPEKTYLHHNLSSSFDDLGYFDISKFFQNVPDDVGQNKQLVVKSLSNLVEEPIISASSSLHNQSQNLSDNPPFIKVEEVPKQSSSNIFTPFANTSNIISFGGNTGQAEDSSSFEKPTTPVINKFKFNLPKFPLNEEQKPSGKVGGFPFPTLGKSEVDGPAVSFQRSTSSISSTNTSAFNKPNIWQQGPQVSKSSGFRFSLSPIKTVSVPPIFPNTSAKPTTQNSSGFNAKNENGGLNQHSEKLEEPKLIFGYDYKISFTPSPSQPKEHFDIDKKNNKDEEKQDEQKLIEERMREEMKRKNEEIARLEKERLIAEQRKREEMEKLKREENERKRIEMEQRMKAEAERIRAFKEMERIREEKRRLEQIKLDVANLVDDLLDEVEESFKRSRLDEIRQKVVHRKSLLFIEKWRDSVARRKRSKKLITNAFWVSELEPRDEAKELLMCEQELTMKNVKRYKLGIPSLLPTYTEASVLKLDTHRLLYPILAQKTSRKSKQIFYKAVISIPDEIELEHGSNRIDQTISQLFDFNSEKSYLETFTTILGDSPTYCIQKYKGVIEENPQKRDINGIIVITKNFNKYFVDRLSELIRNNSIYHSTAVYIILEDNLLNLTSLKAYLNQKLVTNYVIISTSLLNQNLASSVAQGLKFIADKLEQPPPLEMELLRSFLLQNLGSEFWTKIDTISVRNHPYRTCLKSPKIVVNLYNEAVNHLKDIIFDPNLQLYSDFPEEFHDIVAKMKADVGPYDYKYFPTVWKNHDYKKQLQIKFKQLILPDYEAIWPPKCQRDLEQIVYNYCAQVFKSPASKFYLIMGKILKDIKNEFQNIKNVVWTGVIDIIVNEKIMEIDFTLDQPNVTDFDEYFVVYNKEKLVEHNQSFWFYLENPIIKQALHFENEDVDKDVEEVVNIRKRKSYDILDLSDEIDLDLTLKMLLDDGVKQQDVINKRKRTMEDFKRMVDDLDESISVSQKINEKISSSLCSFFK